jgi:hypothetical protein
MLNAVTCGQRHKGKSADRSLWRQRINHLKEKPRWEGNLVRGVEVFGKFGLLLGLSHTQERIESRRERGKSVAFEHHPREKARHASLVLGLLSVAGVTPAIAVDAADTRTRRPIV